MKTLNTIIRREIAARGVLSFARFMELALYCPVYGYYETKKDNLGQRGDFYTSVSVGKLFGQLLAFQFAEWLEAEVESQKSEVRIVEAGAHDGKLTGDILDWLQSSRPKLFRQIQYCHHRTFDPPAEMAARNLEQVCSACLLVFRHQRLKTQSSKFKTVWNYFFKRTS